MQDYKNRYDQSQYQQGYSNEFEMELDPEFEMEENYEYENNYETEPELELASDYEYGNDQESGSQLNSEFELEENYETDPEFESDYEFDRNYESSDYETDPEFETQDNESNMDMESDLASELSYVSNEMELENWVNEIAVRDHRTKNIRNTPAGRTTLKQLSRIAVKTLPGIGSAVGGWKGRPIYSPLRKINPYIKRPYWQRPVVNPLRNRYLGRPPYNRPGMHNRYWNRYPYRRPGNIYNTYPLATPPYYQNQAPVNDQSYADSNAAPSQGNDINSFMKLVLDAIRNLSQQPQGGNDIEQAKNAIIPSAIENYPGILKPKADQQPAPVNADAGQPNPTPDAQTPGDEKEFELYGEIMDNEESFNEVSEMELASELLSINNEQELDFFIKDIFKKAVGMVSGFVDSDSGKALKSMLKKVAKKALPMIGTAAGGFFGGPLGAQAGGKIAQDVSNLFELELEGLSAEDRDFETAKAYVRLAGNAAKQGDDPQFQSGNPVQDAKHALTEAAKRFAPGMLVSN